MTSTPVQGFADERFSALRDTLQQQLDTAEELFSHRSFEAVSIRDLTEKAGVKPPRELVVALGFAETVTFTNAVLSR